KSLIYRTAVGSSWSRTIAPPCGRLVILMLSTAYNTAFHPLDQLLPHRYFINAVFGEDAGFLSPSLRGCQFGNPRKLSVSKILIPLDQFRYGGFRLGVNFFDLVWRKVAAMFSNGW